MCKCIHNVNFPLSLSFILHMPAPSFRQCSKNYQSQPNMDATIHVRDWVMQIDATSWLIGNKHILRHTQGPRKEDCNCLWENPNDGSHYTLSAAPVPRSNVGPLAPGGHARLIHDAGDESAVFSFGDSLIIKIRITNDDTRQEPKSWRFSLLKKSNSASTFLPSCSIPNMPARPT